MSDNEAQSDKSLKGMIPPTLTVNIDGKAFELSELTIKDFADAEQFIKQERFEALLDWTRRIKGVNLPDNVRAKAIAEVMTTDVPLHEVMSTFSGQLYLLYLSLRKKDPEITLAYLKDKLEVEAILDFVQLVAHITGLIDMTQESEKEGDNPLSTRRTTSTTTSRTPQVEVFQGGDET